MGLHFYEKNHKDLVRKIDEAARAFGYENSNDFLQWFKSHEFSDTETGLLASHLTIGETYFLREKRSFDFLEQIYLPGLIHKRFASDQRISVWCAGCATGEEAYSLAITLTQSIPDIKNWNISILATDINPVFLEKAKKGIYTKWSFRSISESFIEKYFIKTSEKEYQIIPEIRKMVRFSSLNLADFDYSSVKGSRSTLIDIIFCRNVLIYFSADFARQVTERFYESLSEGGILVVSAVEMSSMIAAQFNRINFSGFTIYNKGIPAPAKASLIKHDILPDKPDLRGYPPPLKRADPPLREKVTRRVPDLSKSSASASAPVVEPKPEPVNHYALAKEAADRGKLQDAGEWCVKGIGINKLDPALHYLLATVMQEEGNDEKAILELKTALYLDPGFVLAHFLLGNLSLKAGQRDIGMKSFRNALSSLKRMQDSDILPESDGLTVERFKQIIMSITA